MCVRYTHDCTRTIHATAVCVCHQPNEGRKVHSYCINSSLSFLSRAHLNQQKAPATQYRSCPFGRALNAFPPCSSPSPHLASSTRSSLIYGTKSSSREPQKAVLLFSRNSWAHAQSGKGLVHIAAGSKRVPFVPYGGLATNDSCYSFATQFSLRSAVPPAHSPPSPRVHSSRSPLFFWHVCPGSFRFLPVDY